jgi:hypothetical protein
MRANVLDHHAVPRRTFRRLRQAAGAATALATLSLGACAPILTHGPRVRDGSSAGVTAAVISNSEGEAMYVVMPYVSHGNDRGAGNGGSQFTGQWMIPAAAFTDEGENEGLIWGLQGDYYRQAPIRHDRIIHGFGVHAGFVQIMPYVQVGLYDEGVGVFTSQGIGSFGTWFGLVPESVFWSPGVGAEVDIRDLTVRASLSTMIGVRMDRMDRIEGMPIAIGIAIEGGAPFAGRGAREDD